MSLITILIFIIAIIALILIGVFIIDKTFTGPIAEWAWVAKIIIGLIALVAVVALLLSVTGGPDLLSVRVGK
jgi:NADH:ubiquinone oxidoreductase subunit 6 (subunit J)